MSLFEAILLGLIQGITEFLPISSSGHLIIVEQLLGVESDFGVFFNILLHLGTMIAVMIAFKKEVIKLFYSALGILNDIRKNVGILFGNFIYKQEKRYYKLLRTTYRKLFTLLLFSFIPTSLLGYLLRTVFDGFLNSFMITGLGLLVTGLLLFVSEYAWQGNKNLKNTSWNNALLIGACQGFSVIPGISRFGMTLTSGLLMGFHKTFAIKYSFLLSIPTLLGAVIYELLHISEQSGITVGFVLYAVLGAVVAAFSGYFTIRLFLKLVNNGKLRWISYYCLLLGLFVIILNLL